MSDELARIGVHPAGEQSAVAVRATDPPVMLDSFAGSVRVEWDQEVAFAPLGQRPFFIHFLKAHIGFQGDGSAVVGGFWKYGKLASYRAPGRREEEGFEESGQQRLSALSRVVDELEEAEIDRELLLRNSAMGPQPRAQ